MTSEEFGVDLLQVLRLCGSIQAFQLKYAAAVFQSNKEKMIEILSTKQRLENELRLAMDSLSDAYAAEVMRRYEWVSSL